MSELLTPRFQLSVVRRHEAESVREQAFDFKRASRQWINAEPEFASLQGTSPPNLPKWQMTDGKRSVIATDISFQIGMEFENGLPAKTGVRKLFEKPIELIRHADTYYVNGGRFYHALIMVVLRPYSGELKEIAQQLRQRFGKSDNDDIASFNISDGWLIDDHYLNREFSQYSFFKFEFTSAQAAGGVHIDADFLEPTDKGVQVKLEVNSKPTTSNSNLPDFAKMLDSLEVITNHHMVSDTLEMSVPF